MSVHSNSSDDEFFPPLAPPFLDDLSEDSRQYPVMATSTQCTTKKTENFLPLDNHFSNPEEDEEAPCVSRRSLRTCTLCYDAMEDNHICSFCPHCLQDHDELSPVRGLSTATTLKSHRDEPNEDARADTTDHNDDEDEDSSFKQPYDQRRSMHRSFPPPQPHDDDDIVISSCAWEPPMGQSYENPTQAQKDEDHHELPPMKETGASDGDSDCQIIHVRKPPSHNRAHDHAHNHENYFQDTGALGDDFAPNYPSSSVDGYRKRKRDMDQVDPDHVRDPEIPSDIPLFIEVLHVLPSSAKKRRLSNISMDPVLIDINASSSSSFGDSSTYGEDEDDDDQYEYHNVVDDLDMDSPSTQDTYMDRLLDSFPPLSSSKKADDSNVIKLLDNDSKKSNHHCDDCNPQDTPFHGLVPLTLPTMPNCTAFGSGASNNQHNNNHNLPPHDYPLPEETHPEYNQYDLPSHLLPNPNNNNHKDALFHDRYISPTRRHNHPYMMTKHPQYDQYQQYPPTNHPSALSYGSPFFSSNHSYSNNENNQNNNNDNYNHSKYNPSVDYFDDSMFQSFPWSSPTHATAAAAATGGTQSEYQ